MRTSHGLLQESGIRKGALAVRVLKCSCHSFQGILESVLTMSTDVNGSRGWEYRL